MQIQSKGTSEAFTISQAKAICGLDLPFIPPYDKETRTYVASGAANNDLVATRVFKNAGTTVATLTYTYFGATNNIQTITLS